MGPRIIIGWWLIIWQTLIRIIKLVKRRNIVFYLLSLWTSAFFTFFGKIIQIISSTIANSARNECLYLFLFLFLLIFFHIFHWFSIGGYKIIIRGLLHWNCVLNEFFPLSSTASAFLTHIHQIVTFSITITTYNVTFFVVFVIFPILISF